MIFLTGDIHGIIDICKLNTNNFPFQKKLTKSDYVIILGDFGLLWKNKPDSNEKYWLKWLNDKNFTTLVVDGNHDNPYRFYSLPQKEMFGSKVGMISDSIFHLKRGEIYIIDGNKIFVMGGAYSIDQYSRTEGKSWWREEQPSYKEYDYGLKNLENHNNKVDYIIGHTGPQRIITQYLHSLGLYHEDNKDGVAKYFDNIIDIITFQKFYFGHMHDNFIFENGKYVMLYESIVELGKDFTYYDYNEKG
jgi:DNA repair exonuclease SbcCD nuclease subunit